MKLKQNEKNVQFAIYTSDKVRKNNANFFKGSMNGHWSNTEI